MKKLLTLCFFMMSLNAFSMPAVQPAEEGISESQAMTADCIGAMENLRNYMSARADLDRREIDSFYNVATTMESWYGQLRQWEGNRVYVSYGTFRPIGQSADTAERNARLFNREKTELRRDLDTILTQIAHCY